MHALFVCLFVCLFTKKTGAYTAFVAPSQGYIKQRSNWCMKIKAAQKKEKHAVQRGILIQYIKQKEASSASIVWS